MTLRHLQDSLQTYLLGEAEERSRVLPLLEDGRGISRELRLHVYHHAYRARLREALGNVFERTWSYLGDVEFAAASTRHIEAHPSIWRNLRDYGADFPATLRATMPEDPEVAELATMDWNLHIAFDAPNAPLLDPAGLAALSEEDWTSAGFVLHPSVSMAIFEWNALEVWHAIDQKKTPPPARRLPQPMAHLFWRSALASRFRSLADAEYAALRDLAAGAAFAAICERVTPEQAGAWLRAWIADELLSGVVTATAPAHPVTADAKNI
ncbi:MAG: putative DNA-binding domain-containing protein [Burkholderiales bacterium]|nr:putative DNA-binding domain-containing protein [Burkholderiales bacterium]